MAVNLLNPTPLYCSVLLSLQLFTLPVNSQVVVDNNKFCDKFSLGCGKPGGPCSQRYCCVEGNGDIPIYRCCNPYTVNSKVVEYSEPSLGCGKPDGPSSQRYCCTEGDGIGVAVPTIIVLIIFIILCCILYFIYAQYHRKKRQALLQSYQRSQCNRSDSAIALTISHGDTPPTTLDTTPTENVATSKSVAAQSGESTEIPLEDVPLLSDNDENES